MVVVAKQWLAKVAWLLFQSPRNSWIASFRDVATCHDD
jgi:hypothetical protein